MTYNTNTGSSGGGVSPSEHMFPALKYFGWFPGPEHRQRPDHTLLPCPQLPPGTKEEVRQVPMANTKNGEIMVYSKTRSLSGAQGYTRRGWVGGGSWQWSTR